MTSNFEFTDKTQETLAAAIQLAKDYANAQGTKEAPYLSYVANARHSSPSAYRVRVAERRRW